MSVVLLALTLTGWIRAWSAHEGFDRKTQTLASDAISTQSVWNVGFDWTGEFHVFHWVTAEDVSGSIIEWGFTPLPPSGWRHFRMPPGRSSVDPNDDPDVRKLRLGRASVGTSTAQTGEVDRQTFRWVTVPTWLLATAFAAGPGVVAVRRWRTRDRHRAGHCRQCGYDLRATPQRCPECGAGVS